MRVRIFSPKSLSLGDALLTAEITSYDLLKRQRVLDTIRIMLDNGESISFAAIARTARVSTRLVHAEGVREHAQAAIQRQEPAPVTSAVQGRRAGTRQPPRLPGNGPGGVQRTPHGTRRFASVKLLRNSPKGSPS
ncbi:hypothetical protein [Streptomyces lydicus]|uniref:hypothetical protein n=1 Tax=Streptomyces lydicus TaxID=47763 RepID=UPI00371E380B